MVIGSRKIPAQLKGSSGGWILGILRGSFRVNLGLGLGVGLGLGFGLGPVPGINFGEGLI